MDNKNKRVKDFIDWCISNVEEFRCDWSFDGTDDSNFTINNVIVACYLNSRYYIKTSEPLLQTLLDLYKNRDDSRWLEYESKKEHNHSKRNSDSKFARRGAIKCNYDFDRIFKPKPILLNQLLNQRNNK